ncbi:hypothetical protein P5673_018077 [Acropora cervicornis]|uniref:Integrase zinc-binding domain-containing protein n=1 Tax=Acropora cervicornis TaxID=6130 RepID=A0AAD9V368_ACRCE|nr:hypothetical protein P5673_018077 [Acropora cervicornis]
MIKRSTLYHLNPFIDDDGILRLGGRLRRSKLEYREKHPVLMPKKHHVTTLIVRHYHLQVHHQGRLMTHGAIRQAGYWLVNGNQVVSNELNSCVTCKRLRGRPLEQQMADLPNDRMEETAPFTYVGFDVFGPLTIQPRKTRGAAVTSKRWGLLFTFLNSRAVHIEEVEPFQRAPAASPDPDPETPLVGPASSPVEADCVGEPALPSSVHEDSAQPLRRSTRERRPPERFKDFIMSVERHDLSGGLGQVPLGCLGAEERCSQANENRSPAAHSMQLVANVNRVSSISKC